VYLTPSSLTAANYATSNEYGSEALEHFMMLWNRLQERKIRLPRAITDSARPILNFIARPKVPILIRAEGVHAKMLIAENGDAPLKSFELLEKLMEEPLFTAVCQQTNFEWIGVIPINNLEVFEILVPSSNPAKEPALAPYGSGQEK
jgi:hypothetical protein